MAKCRGCGEEIIFIKSPAGEFIPCNPSKVIYSNPGEGKARVVTQNGEVVSCTVGAVNLQGGEPVQKEEGEGKPVTGIAILIDRRQAENNEH